MTFLDPQHPIHPEHIPLFIVAWELMKHTARRVASRFRRGRPGFEELNFKGMRVVYTDGFLDELWLVDDDGKVVKKIKYVKRRKGVLRDTT